MTAGVRCWRWSGVIGWRLASRRISWFAIVFTGRQPRGLWDFTQFFMRWRGSAVAYMALLRDEYPPFGPGDGSYPASFGVADFPEARDRWSVGLRLIYVIPQAIVLFFLGIAWAITAIIGWFAILLTGRYPEGLYTFGGGVRALVHPRAGLRFADARRVSAVQLRLA